MRLHGLPDTSATRHFGIKTLWDTSAPISRHFDTKNSPFRSLSDLAPSPDVTTSAINTAARMIYRASRYDHVSSLLKELHWLRVPGRIEFKLCAHEYKCLNGNGPAYLADSLQRVTDVQSRRRLRSSSSSSLIVQHWETVRFRSSPPGLGTAYQTTSRQRQPSHHSVLR